jgi:hypothetical protein
MKFLSGKPAMSLEGALIISDLHLGMEFELRKKGVRLPLQHKKLANEVNSLLKQSRAKQFIVLGDVKHDVYGFWEREKMVLREFFESLACEKILVLKGNHDGNLEELRVEGKDFEVAPAEGVVYAKKYGLIHGHAWPAQELLETDFLLMGHNQPVVEFCANGFCWRERAWIVGNMVENKRHGTRKKQKTIIFPAFNPLSGGQAFNSNKLGKGEEFLGPLLKNNLVDLGNAHAFLLNGIDLGKLRDLRKYTEEK